MKGSSLAKAVKEVIARAPSVKKVYLRELVVDWESKGTPAVVLTRMGGAPDDGDRVPRFRIDVLGVGGDEVADTLEEIRDELVYAEMSSGCSCHVTSHGLIDDVEVEQDHVDVAYPSSTIRQTSMTIRAYTRDI